MMTWLKKGILFILSTCLLSLGACQNKIENQEIIEEEVVITATDKVSTFFKELENWNDYSIDILNQLGTKISKLDTSLQFFPNINDYEIGAFIFSSNHLKNLDIFVEQPFLKEDKPQVFSTYKVWRKEINNVRILDLSIEPHPTLHWIFVVRIRQQE